MSLSTKCIVNLNFYLSHLKFYVNDDKFKNEFFCIVRFHF